MPRLLELVLVFAVVYPLDRLYAHFLFPHVSHWQFMLQPLPFLAVLLSFLVLVWVPVIRWVWARTVR